MTESELSRTPLGCHRRRDTQHEHTSDKSALIILYCHVTMDQNLKAIFCIVWGGGIFDTYFPCAGGSVLTCVGPYEIYIFSQIPFYVFSKFSFFCFNISGLLFND